MLVLFLAKVYSSWRTLDIKLIKLIYMKLQKNEK